jgi:hypothetical protein
LLNPHSLAARFLERSDSPKIITGAKRVALRCIATLRFEA